MSRKAHSKRQTGQCSSHEVFVVVKIIDTPAGLQLVPAQPPPSSGNDHSTLGYNSSWGRGQGFDDDFNQSRLG